MALLPVRCGAAGHRQGWCRNFMEQTCAGSGEGGTRLGRIETEKRLKKRVLVLWKSPSSQEASELYKLRWNGEGGQGLC
jgi:hypothetical protein